MIIAGMNITYRHFLFEHFLNGMERAGIGSIELWAGEPHFYVGRDPLSTLRSIRKEVKARKLNVVCYTPEQCVYPYNLAASDPEWRARSVAYFKENLYAAVELEAPMMLVTSGIGDFAVPQADSWNFASDSIAQLARIAEAEGLLLALEPLTSFETNLITSLRDVRSMMTEIGSPSLRGMIDTVAMQLADETPDDYFAAPGGLLHVHLIDGDGQSDAHLALGDGALNWESYVQSLQKHGYRGCCTLEIMGSRYYANPQEAIEKSLDKLRQFGFSS
ncbi:sugar phosphate isomerase/epimerase family protein [Paenibacillus tyrfis]|uniref:sugar phosphate isomerase/epimerase family protein n=1 Tax=Paenibacillus tyrfis TaxID=1501230 RepID=UPI0020A1703D|nr:TIM barrel protein [Paenibacillus tyrfis]MCP1310127.1 TIM barrel protein [Paenibacillus tyrfis]